MKIVGLTGGIASGKSTVSSMLKDLGATVIDADLISRELVLPGSFALQELEQAFGSQIMNSNGTLNRRLLGEIVFGHLEELHRLNEIMLPKISEEIKRLLDSYQKAGQAVVIVDAPLLFESNLTGLVNVIWVVYVPEWTQLTRLVERDGLTMEQARQRIHSQMSIEHKKDLADIVIDNSGSMEDTNKQVEELWNRLLHTL